jgi:hypothetical protein
MPDPDYMVFYPDAEGTPPDGELYYPSSLLRIAPALTELNAELIDDIDVYIANIGLEIDMILGFFIGVHDAHEAALQILNSYRNEGRQYAVYLRNFDWSGEYSSGELRLVSGDRHLKKSVADALPSEIPMLSFVNTLDGYLDNENNHGTDTAVRGLIPSVRLLTHNWQETVREVILGARLVILNARGPTDGIVREAKLLAACGMKSRTVVIGPRVSASDLFAANGFADIVDQGSHFQTIGPLSDAVSARLTDAIHALTTDSFVQTNQVADLSELPCWVVDRNIADASEEFSADKLAGVPYENYVPSSLLNNFTVFFEQYPHMLTQWDALEAKSKGSERISRNELLEALYQAVHVFHIATTVERYYEMATALSVIGMASKSLTGRRAMRLKCYKHALKCARWSGDAEHITFFAGALAHLQQEAAAVD